MAQKRFYFWESYAKAFDLLDDAARGRFIQACYRFAFDGTEPDFEDEPSMVLAWQIVRGQIEESVAIGIRNSERGRRGGAASHGGGRPRKKQAVLVPKTSGASATGHEYEMNGLSGATAPSGVASAPASLGEEPEAIDEY